MKYTFPGEIKEVATVVSTGFMERYCPNVYATYDFGALYDEYNDEFFGGSLPELKVKVVPLEYDEEGRIYPTVKWEGRFRRLWGSYMPNGGGSGVIKIARRCVKVPWQVESTLIHEMVHAYLDMRGEDTGIKGHGPTFIREAKRINEMCERQGVEYRVHFYDEEVTREEAFFEAGILPGVKFMFDDLDVAKAVEGVIRGAFHEDYCYRQ